VAGDDWSIKERWHNWLQPNSGSKHLLPLAADGVDGLAHRDALLGVCKILGEQAVWARVLKESVHSLRQ
jgi:hypothetical protein